MRLLSIKADGIGPLRDIDVDFSSLGPGLIALVGATGHGKSSLLELTGPACFYRTFAFYDTSVFDHMLGKSGFAETTYDIGGKQVVFKLVGAKQGKKREAYLTIDGNPVAGPNLGDYDEKVAPLVPDRDLILSSMFAVQGGAGSFGRIDRAVRRSMIAKLLGVDRYEAYALESSRRQRTARQQEETTQPTFAELEAQFIRRNGLLAELEATSLACEFGESVGEVIDAELITAETYARGAHFVVIEAQTKKGALEERLQNILLELNSCNSNISVLQRKVANRPEPVDHTALQAELATVSAQVEQLRADKVQAELVLAERSTIYGNEEAQRLLIVPTIDNMTNLIATAKKKLDTILSSLCGVTSCLASVDLTNAMCVECALTKEGQNALCVIDAARKEEEEVRLCAEAEIAVLNIKLQERTVETKRLMADVAVAEGFAVATSRDLKEFEQKQSDLARKVQTALASIAVLSGHERDLATLASLVEQRTKLESESSDVAAKDREIKVPQEELVKARAIAEGLKEKLAEWVRNQNELGNNVARISGVLKELESVPSKLEQARSALVVLRQDAEDWSRLKWACDMLRTLHIDSACPEVSQIATDLLSGFQDGRFRVELRTLVQAKSKETQKEDFIPIVIDGETGREADKLSGGETAVCDEALRGAINIYRAKRAGLVMETAWRDETAGSLDGDTAQHYMVMLKRMWKISGVHQLLFVSHSPDVYAQADRRIFIRKGKIEAID